MTDQATIDARLEQLLATAAIHRLEHRQAWVAIVPLNKALVLQLEIPHTLTCQFIALGPFAARDRARRWLRCELETFVRAGEPNTWPPTKP